MKKKKPAKKAQKPKMVDARHFVLPYVIVDRPVKLRCGCIENLSWEKLFCKRHMPKGQCQDCGTWSIYTPVMQSGNNLKCVNKNDCYRRSHMKMWAARKA